MTLVPTPDRRPPAPLGIVVSNVTPEDKMAKSKVLEKAGAASAEGRAQAYLTDSATAGDRAARRLQVSGPWRNVNYPMLLGDLEQAIAALIGLRTMAQRSLEAEAATSAEAATPRRNTRPPD